MIHNASANPEAEPTEEAFLFTKVFEKQANLAMVLSPDLIIKAATDSYLRETLTLRENIIGKQVFRIFPDNPDLDGASPTANLQASIQQALTDGKTHQMAVYRYDIPDPKNSGLFLERYWRTSNTPLLDQNGKLLCIIHETANVTEAEKARLQLLESQEREQAANAQAELQRMRLERLFDQAPAAMAILEGPDLVYKDINAAYQQLFPGRELVGLPLFRALPELRNSVVYDIIYKVYNTGETFEGKEVLIPVARFENQDPEDIYWNFIYQAIYDKQQKINGILIFALDVTNFVDARRALEKSAAALQVLNQDLEQRVTARTQELHLAQAETKQQWQQLEDLMMHAPSAICILTGPDLTFSLINPVYQQIFPGRMLLGKPLLEALPELAHTFIPEQVRRVYQTGEKFVGQEILLSLARHDNGPLEEIYWTFTCLAHRNREGIIDSIMVFAHEVTDQVKTRKAIEANAQQLRLITDALPVLIGYIDKERRYQFANRAYEAWFPVKAPDLIGRNLRDVVGEKAYRNAEGYVNRVLAGERLDFEAVMPYREGFTKHIRTSYVPDVREGEVVGFYTLVSDITEQVEARQRVEQSAQETREMAKELAQANQHLQLANQELSRANEQLTHTNIDLDNFIYAASHDLKAPISNIEMLLEELLLELPAESYQTGDTPQLITLIRDAIDRFKKTIFNLTEISKLPKGDHTEAALVQVAEVVAEVQLDLAVLIEETGAQITTNINPNLPLSFSPKNLRSIVYNLLSNAIKYRHPLRTPIIQVRFFAEEECLVLTVQDNGLGLSPANQAKLFSMFRRFHDHVEGSGVGLYMVKRIIDNAGGKITIESKLDEGSTFRVYFRQYN
ncbi:MAG: PAS domain-containing protein [Adhaeribacter sp.]